VSATPPTRACTTRPGSAHDRCAPTRATLHAHARDGGEVQFRTGMLDSARARGSGLILEWQRRRKFVPKIYEVETSERARCWENRCSKLACWPDAKCALHTRWLEGTVAQRLAADSWAGGPEGHRRAQAWALWRARAGLPKSSDVFVPLLPEAT
jgi:hypothetical protein